jgi:hypothetical protein
VIQPGQKAYGAGQVKVKHPTTLLCTNRIGEGPPPLVILNCLVNQPAELRHVKHFTVCWFTFAAKGRMTGCLFN